MRSRLKGWLAVAAYVTAAVICPAAHLWHHSVAGANHTHGASETTAHVALALDLATLGLGDVGAPAVVDCSLAAFTLADCDTPTHETRHFGDDSASGPSMPPPIDIRHGAGSLEHLGVSILAVRSFMLPPPLLRETRLAVFARPALRSLDLTLTLRSRGPPSSIV